MSKVTSDGHHLLAIINDVLDISKIEAGKLTLNSNEFSLAAVIDHVHSMMAQALRAKSLAWRVALDPALPPILYGDAVRLGQILLNYVGNAAKFTETGPISAQARVTDRHEVALTVRVEVQDTGPGLSAVQRARLFLGKTDSFPDGTRAVPIDQAQNSPLRDTFYEAIAGKSAAQLKAYCARIIFSGKGEPPRRVSDSKAARAALLAIPTAIAYLDRSELTPDLKIVFAR